MEEGLLLFPPAQSKSPQSPPPPVIDFVETLRALAEQRSPAFDNLLINYIKHHQDPRGVHYDEVAALIYRARESPRTVEPSDESNESYTYLQLASKEAFNGDPEMTDLWIGKYVRAHPHPGSIDTLRLANIVVESRWSAFRGALDTAGDCANKQPPEWTNPDEVRTHIKRAAEFSARINGLPDAEQSAARDNYLKERSEFFLKEAYQNGIRERLTAASQLAAHSNPTPDQVATFHHHLTLVKQWSAESPSPLNRDQVATLATLEQQFRPKTNTSR
jgi:hypothetical protein